jgi:hypothetical protein
MSVRTREYTYTRINKKGEEVLYSFTGKYTAKTETKSVGKLKCYNKITTCTEFEQMQKLLTFMDELGI